MARKIHTGEQFVDLIGNNSDLDDSDSDSTAVVYLRMNAGTKINSSMRHMMVKMVKWWTTVKH